METTLELFQYMEAMLGGECQCGKKGLKCVKECCPGETEFCHWEVLGTLKEVLEEYESLKIKEEVFRRKLLQNRRINVKW